MAEEQDDTEKTEDPTQKRLDDALKRGDVAKSQEVYTWFILAGATLVLMSFSGSMSHEPEDDAGRLLANAHHIRDRRPRPAAADQQDRHRGDRGDRDPALAADASRRSPAT